MVSRGTPVIHRGPDETWQRRLEGHSATIRQDAHVDSDRVARAKALRALREEEEETTSTEIEYIR